MLPSEHVCSFFLMLAPTLPHSAEFMFMGGRQAGKGNDSECIFIVKNRFAKIVGLYERDNSCIWFIINLSQISKSK